jgi:hypothetical protein
MAGFRLTRSTLLGQSAPISWCRPASDGIPTGASDAN